MDYMIFFPAKMKKVDGFCFHKIVFCFLILNFSDVAFNRVMSDDPKSYIRL